MLRYEKLKFLCLSSPLCLTKSDNDDCSFFLTSSDVARLPNSRTILTLVSKVTESAGQGPWPEKRLAGMACRTRSPNAPHLNRGWAVSETILSAAAVEMISV